MQRLVAALIMALTATPAHADPARAELHPYYQCAPYARQVSGIEIYGNANTWWEQAQGRFSTGPSPVAGSVMTFRATPSMRSGHVAMVSRVLDSRRVLLDHANWSPIEGRRGQIEKDVLAVDVSPNNDWSAVRVWYSPLNDVGTTVWPVSGFIYANATPREPKILPQATGPVRNGPSAAFRNAFADLPN